MVMGPTHAASGAAAWLLGAGTITAATGHQLSTSQLLIGAGVCAGSALLPDIDSPGSTVARSLGPVTEVIAKVVSAGSVAIYRATATPKDSPRTGGHRTVTHTALCAVLTGAAVSALTSTVGIWAVVGVLFFTLSLALRGLMADWARREGWIGVSIAAAAGAAWAMTTAGQESFWWLGAAVTAGMLLHDLGDMITAQGCPITAPLPHRGKAWWEWAPPGFLRIRAGGGVESVVLLPVLSAVTVLGLLKVLSPSAFDAIVTIVA